MGRDVKYIQLRWMEFRNAPGVRKYYSSLNFVCLLHSCKTYKFTILYGIDCCALGQQEITFSVTKMKIL